jgi:hypothetical protein
MVLLGGLSLFAEFAAEKPSMLNDSYFSDLQDYTAILNETTVSNINSMEADFNSNQSSVGTFGWLDDLVGRGWNMVKGVGNTFKLFSFAGSAMTGISNVLGFPEWFLGLVTLLVVILIIFAIFSAIFRTEV